LIDNKSDEDSCRLNTKTNNRTRKKKKNCFKNSNVAAKVKVFF